MGPCRRAAWGTAPSAGRGRPRPRPQPRPRPRVGGWQAGRRMRGAGESEAGLQPRGSALSAPHSCWAAEPGQGRRRRRRRPRPGQPGRPAPEQGWNWAPWEERRKAMAGGGTRTRAACESRGATWPEGPRPGGRRWGLSRGVCTGADAARRVRNDAASARAEMLPVGCAARRFQVGFAPASSGVCTGFASACVPAAPAPQAPVCAGHDRTRFQAPASLLLLLCACLFTLILLPCVARPGPATGSRSRPGLGAATALLLLLLQGSGESLPRTLQQGPTGVFRP